MAALIAGALVFALGVALVVIFDAWFAVVIQASGGMAMLSGSVAINRR